MMKEQKSTVAIFRRLQGYSQRQLSLLSGINRCEISFFENGQRKPNAVHKEKLARVLGVKKEILFPSEKKDA
jgi:transcriptional regulator with XRE-family HTH domain